METITYAQVRELVEQLPESKLPVIYRMLVHLREDDSSPGSPQRDFMVLPSAERRRILEEQAKLMAAHYESTVSDRQDMQAGDFVEY